MLGEKPQNLAQGRSVEACYVSPAPIPQSPLCPHLWLAEVGKVWAAFPEGRSASRICQEWPLFLLKTAFDGQGWANSQREGYSAGQARPGPSAASCQST